MRLGDSTVRLSGDEIIVDNFLGPAMGIGGLGSESWGGFSFDRLDEFVYKKAKKTNYDHLWIVLKYYSKDKYGNLESESPITIGKINAVEAKKYVDYSHWHTFNNRTYEMWAKDRDAYNREMSRLMRNSGTSVVIAPAYRPKSIR
jgi:hypothetical protein